MNTIYNDTSAILDEILQRIWEDFGDEDVQLKIGIWDHSASPYSFYAVVESADREQKDYQLIGGESTYGSETIHEALADLLNELRPPQE